MYELRLSSERVALAILCDEAFSVQYDMELYTSVGMRARYFFHDDNNALFALSAVLTRLFDECQRKQVGRKIIPEVIRLLDSYRERREYWLAVIGLAGRQRGSWCPLSKFIKEVLSVFARSSLYLSYDIDAAAGQTDVWLPDWHILLCNILGNAVTAMDSLASAHREMTITVKSDKTGLVLLVQDNGPGIREELRQRIWLPGFTTWKGRSEMGLSVAARIVSAFGGKISEEGVYGAGARFCIQVPYGKGVRRREDIALD